MLFFLCLSLSFRSPSMFKSSIWLTDRYKTDCLCHNPRSKSHSFSSMNFYVTFFCKYGNTPYDLSKTRKTFAKQFEQQKNVECVIRVFVIGNGQFSSSSSCFAHLSIWSKLLHLLLIIKVRTKKKSSFNVLASSFGALFKITCIKKTCAKIKKHPKFQISAYWSQTISH